MSGTVSVEKFRLISLLKEGNIVQCRRCCYTFDLHYTEAQFACVSVGIKKEKYSPGHCMLHHALHMTLFSPAFSITDH